MMTVKIIAVGSLKEKYWREAVAEYTKRLSSFCRFEIEEVSEERLADNPSKVQIEAALEKEAVAICAKLLPRVAVIALCIEGKPFTSEGLAKVLSDFATGGQSSICFVIGSSYGLSKSLKDKVAVKMSFSPMTFPHQLIRVMLTEQIYRAFCILDYRPYHK